MRRLAIAAILAWSMLAQPAWSSETESKLVDLTFLHRLQADQVPFSPDPLISSNQSGVPRGYPGMTYQPYIQAGAEEILDRLIAAHPGPKPPHITFLVSTAPGFNCTTLLTGEIACTYAVLEMLLPTQDGRDQLAFLLAHELGHRLITGHGTRFAKSDKIKADWARMGLMTAVALDIALSKRTQTGDTITVTATPAATSALWNGLFGGIYAGQTASGLASLAWSQKEEDEADQYGVFLMQRAGFDINAPVQLFGSLELLVQSGRLAHESVTKLVLTKAANGAAIQALVNGKGWANIVGGGLFAGLSAMDEVSADHYHRDFGDRTRRCKAIIGALEPDASDADRMATFASYSPPVAADAAPAIAAAAPPPAPVAPVAPVKHSGGRLARSARRAPQAAPAATAAPAPPPPSPWALAQTSYGALQEIQLSQLVIQTLATQGDGPALKLCPPRPQTPQLALSCGLALAGDGQKADANTLFRQALADRDVGPGAFRTVALAQGQMNDESDALATLDAADHQFPSGEFYPDRITLMLKAGDTAGARAVADNCKNSNADTGVKLACGNLALQIKS